MPIKVQQFAQIQGMNQDISPSKRTDKLAYEIKNMRVTIEDDNTLLTWTNEKGTKQIDTQLPDGKVLGSCVINDELILFINNSTSSNPDCICGIIDIDTLPRIIYYYKGNLGFDKDSRFETIGVIENSKLHKVYWIDGINQPRFINIANKEIKEGNTVYSSDNTQFDFLPTDNIFKQTVEFEDESTIDIERTLKVQIEKVYQVGLFKAGTIQYAFNYYNLNGAQTNLVYISPIQYISSQNRGNNVDETVNCAFKIKCYYVNKDFDYLRIYSISRTSTDTTPQVRIVTDIPTSNAQIEHIFIDKETSNSSGRRAPQQYNTSYILRYSKNEAREDNSNIFQVKQMEYSIAGNIYRNPKNDAPSDKEAYMERIFSQQDNLRDFIISSENTLYNLDMEDHIVWGGYVYYAGRNARIRITKQEEANYPGYYTYTLSSFVDTGVSNADNTIHRRKFISVQEESDYTHTDSIVGSISAPVLEFTDNGTSGSIFDYNALLFMNNSAIVPNTMDQKDNTLFIGNYHYKENNDFELKQAIEESGIKANDLIRFVNVQLTTDFANQYYPYTNQNAFSADEIMGFKGGEQYIFGFMVQNKQDKWSSVIAFKDVVTNNIYPKVEETDQNLINKSDDKKYTTYIVQAVLNDTIEDDQETVSPYRKLINIIKEKGEYKAIKFVIVAKNTAQRNVVCQGILCPTVFCQENRIKHLLPFAQSSWFFRPTMRHNPSYYETSDSSMVPEFRHYNLIGGEIQSSSEILSEAELDSGHVPDYFEITAGYTRPISYDRVQTDVEQNSDYYGNTRFGVDNQILTMHSPDIELDSTVQSILDDNDILKFRIIGYTKVHSTYSDADISVKRKSFFYERNINGESKAMTGRIITGQDKQINVYNQKYPAAGMSAYNGLLGDTYYNYSYTREEGEDINTYTDKGELNNTYYKIYPWHRSTSLNAQPTPSIEVIQDSSESISNTVLEDSYWQIPLETKQLSNVRVCCKTKLGQDYIWRPLTQVEEDSDKRGIGNIYVWYPTDKVTKINDVTYPWDNQITYEGNIDTVINVSPKRCYWLEYSQKRGGGGSHTKMNGHLRSNDLIRMKYKSSAHAVFNLSFNRYKSNNGDDYYQQWILPKIKDSDVVINTQWSGYQTVSWDIPGKEGTNVKTFDFKNINCYNAVDDQYFKETYTYRRGSSSEDREIYNYSSDRLEEIANYCKSKITNFIYENTSSEYYILVIYSKYQRQVEEGEDKYTGIVIHCIIEDRDRKQEGEYKVENNILYVGDCFKDENHAYIVNHINNTTGVLTVKKVDIPQEQEQDQSDIITAGNNLYTIKDYRVDPEDDGIFYIGELYQDTQLSTSEHELQNYNWQAASDSISLYEDIIPKLYGDTYFQRYDCLKTFSTSPEDPNQVVDIGSFMLETRINMDGRYDRNRGLLSNLNITDTNFNLINKAYTQNDHFVNTYIDNTNLDVSEYPNTITWSLTKVYGEPIDNWTHLTNTSNLDLDGERGTLTKIVNFQDVLLFFQTDGAGIIKYNENVALVATNELPVELANSGKVDGKLYLNRIIGCQNKDTIVITKNALYFIDGNTNSIYQMTQAQGLVSPQSITENSFENYMKAQDISTAKGFYNKDKQEVYYIFDNDEAPCISYSENIKQFTSFYDYKPSFFECIGETAYHILNNIQGNNFSIWAQNKGNYNEFYGNKKPFYMTVSANGEDGIVDKIWNNIEFRADTYDDDTLLSDTTFDELNVWNEHQVGLARLTLRGVNGSINSPSNLKKKFRIWRANIPRSQYMAIPKFNKGINNTVANSIRDTYSDQGRGRNRIRNPWTYIQLKNSNPNAYKTILHDLMVYYFE